MPLTHKGKEIEHAMEKEYGKKRASLYSMQAKTKALSKA
jgi:hypothetical protein